MSENILYCLQTEFEYIMSGLCGKQYKLILRRVLHCHALGRFTDMKRNQTNKVKNVYFPLNKEVHSCSDGPYSWLGLISINLAGLFLTIYLKCQLGAFQWIVSIWKERFHYAYQGAIPPLLSIGQALWSWQGLVWNMDLLTCQPVSLHPGEHCQNKDTQESVQLS